MEKIKEVATEEMDTEPLTQPSEDFIDSTEDVRTTSNRDPNDDGARAGQSSRVTVEITNLGMNQYKGNESAGELTTNGDIIMEGSDGPSQTVASLGDNSSEQVIGQVTVEQLNVNESTVTEKDKSTADIASQRFNRERMELELEDDLSDDQKNLNMSESNDSNEQDEKEASSLAPTKNRRSSENGESSRNDVDINRSISFLEKKLAYLGVQFIAKEKEANAILKLMKLVEVEICQVHRQKVLKKIVHNSNKHQDKDDTENKTGLVKTFLEKAISFKDPYVPASKAKLNDEFLKILESDRKNRELFKKMFETEDVDNSASSISVNGNARGIGLTKETENAETVWKNGIHNMIAQALGTQPFSTSVKCSRSEVPHGSNPHQSSESIRTWVTKKVGLAVHQMSPKQQKMVIPSTTPGSTGACKTFKIGRLDPTISYTDMLLGFKRQHENTSNKAAAKKAKQSKLENSERSQAQQTQNSPYGTLLKEHQIINPFTEGTLQRKILASDTKDTPSKRLKKTPRKESKFLLSNIAKKSTESTMQLTLSKSKAYNDETPQHKVQNVDSDQNTVQNDESCLNYNCESCEKAAGFVCSNCQNQWYCSVDCQVAAWTTHQEVCAPQKTTGDSSIENSEPSLP